MSCVYNYNSGKVTLDFHMVAYDEICALRGIKGKAGNRECKRCPFYGGTYTDMSSINWESWVQCKHKDAKDSNNSKYAKSYLIDEFVQRALAHYYD